MTIADFKEFIIKAENPISRLDDCKISDMSYQTRNLIEIFNDFKNGGENLLREGNTLKIGIVGQVKAGKSSFLNSLLFDGETVLPKASTPMTAGLTILEYADTNSFEIDYYTPEEWNEFQSQSDAYKKIEQEIRNNKDNLGAPESFLQKELKSRTSDVMQSAYELVSSCGPVAKSKIGKPSESVDFKGNKDLQKILADYVGANGSFTSVVKSLTIKMNDDRLKGIRIVDTPGVNDPIVSRENRTKEFLHSCHGVFFLSYSSRFFDSMDVSFMNTRIGNQGIGTVVMLASKYDDVLQDQSNKYPDDIEQADENSNQSLRRRFKTQLSQLSNPNIDIDFDTTSGISFSLATKPKSEWDDMETHIDKQMHRVFPSAFPDEEGSRETYLMLANLDSIRDTYLNKKFKNNKDAIISKKFSDYFIQNGQNISTAVNSLISDCEIKIKDLDSVELKDIYRQQEEQDKLFSALKGDFAELIGNFQNSLQTNRDQLYENINRPTIHNLPTEEISVFVTYKGALWGHNTNLFTVSSIDTQSVKEMSLSMLDNYCNAWQKGWQDLFSTAKNKMFDQFCESITEFSKDISDVKFSDRYYRQLMSQLLSSIERHGILKLQDIKNNYQQTIVNLCDGQDLVITNKSYECKESQVQGRLNEDAREISNSLRRVLSNKLDSFANEVQRSVENSIEPIQRELNSLKGTIEGKLKIAGSEYLNNLKKQIEEKEQTKAQIDYLLVNLKEINKAINYE